MSAAGRGAGPENARTNDREADREKGTETGCGSRCEAPGPRARRYRDRMLAAVAEVDDLDLWRIAEHVSSVADGDAPVRVTRYSGIHHGDTRERALIRLMAAVTDLATRQLEGRAGGPDGRRRPARRG